MNIFWPIHPINTFDDNLWFLPISTVWNPDINKKKKRLSDFSTEDLTYNISVSAILSIQYQSNQISELTLYICGNKESSHVLPWQSWMNTSAWLKAAFSYIHTNTLNENDLRSDCFSSFYKSLQTSGSQTFVACPTSEAKKKQNTPIPNK